jgi:hypothetical protein
MQRPFKYETGPVHCETYLSPPPALPKVRFVAKPPNLMGLRESGPIGIAVALLLGSVIGEGQRAKKTS